jgi:hypothetical protein
VTGLAALSFGNAVGLLAGRPAGPGTPPPRHPPAPGPPRRPRPRTGPRWQSWAPHGPDQLWSNLRLSAQAGDSTPTIGVGGTWLGSLTGGVAFDALGGAVNRVSPGSTAFVHRGGLFLAQYPTDWPSGAPADAVSRQQAWLQSFYGTAHRYASGQAYQNYVDPSLANWKQAYYGASYSRLAQVKARYDPVGCSASRRPSASPRWTRTRC